MSHWLNAQQVNNLPHCHIFFGHMTDTRHIALTWKTTLFSHECVFPYPSKHLFYFYWQIIPIIAMRRYSISSIKRFHWKSSSCKIGSIQSLITAAIRNTLFLTWNQKWLLGLCLKNFRWSDQTVQIATGSTWESGWAPSWRQRSVNHL